MNYPDGIIRRVVLATNMKAEQCQEMLSVTRGDVNDAIRLFKTNNPITAVVEYRRELKERDAREAAELEFESRRIQMTIAIDEAATEAGYEIDEKFQKFLSLVLARLIP